MNELKIWIAVRTDLEMSKGKMAVQVAHAAVGCVSKSEPIDQGMLVSQYLLNNQPKIVTRAKSVEHLVALYDACKQSRVTAYLVEDLGRTEFGQPTVTCIGIGPCFREQLPTIAKRLQLWKDEDVTT